MKQNKFNQNRHFNKIHNIKFKKNLNNNHNNLYHMIKIICYIKIKSKKCKKTHFNSKTTNFNTMIIISTAKNIKNKIKRTSMLTK